MPFLSHCIAGLAAASPLFLLAAGLSLGATRTFNVSHGSLGMLGAYVAWSILTRLPPGAVSITLGILATAAVIAMLGAGLDIVLRRLTPLAYLLTTLGILLILQDATVLLWGPSPLVLPQPIDEFALIATGPLVLAGLLLLQNRTPSVAGLAAGLAGLAGALSPTAGPGLDLVFLTNAIIVSLIGGLGSVTGAFLAALVLGLLQGFLPEASPYLAFASLAAILIVRPYGLLGRPRSEAVSEPSLIRATPLSARLLLTAALLGVVGVPFLVGPAILSLLIGALIAILFAASLHFVMGPGGMPSLGHAAFFGVGAYAAALLARDAGMGLALAAAPLAAGIAALLAGALIVRLPFVYLAMLTVAAGQLVWTLAVQIGGSAAIRPDLSPPMFYWLTAALCIGCTLLLRRALNGRFGYALRAVRDDPVRAAAIGLPVYLLRLSAFTLAGATAGLAGGLTAFSHGSVSPADASIARSSEALMMVVLGGLQTISGPIVGAVAGTALLEVTSASRLLIGAALIAVALGCPHGIAGASIRAWRRAA